MASDGIDFEVGRQPSYVLFVVRPSMRSFPRSFTCRRHIICISARLRVRLETADNV